MQKMQSALLDHKQTLDQVPSKKAFYLNTVLTVFQFVILFLYVYLSAHYMATLFVLFLLYNLYFVLKRDERILKHRLVMVYIPALAVAAAAVLYVVYVVLYKGTTIEDDVSQNAT